MSQVTLNDVVLTIRSHLDAVAELTKKLATELGSKDQQIKELKMGKPARRTKKRKAV